VLDALASDRFCPGEPGSFRWIPETLLSHDDYFVIADFASYVATQAVVSREYLDQALWRRKAILNVARVGRFSSDRTVHEYAREIWGLETSE
jgi:starch phosphorylase